MEVRKQIEKLIILLGFLVVLSGCADRQEIEKKAYIVALGMDKADNQDQIKVTYLIANPAFSSQQEGGDQGVPPVEIISFITNDIVSAQNKANTVIAKEISYELLRTIAVSEDLAKDKDLIRWMYDATKDPEIRRDLHFIVTKEDTLRFFENTQPLLERKPHEYFELILTRGAQIGFIPNSLLMHYFRITEADAELYLAPYGSIEKSNEYHHSDSLDNYKAGDFHFEGKTNKTNFIGSAVFKEGQMIGTMTGEETRIAMLLDNTMRAPDIIATFPDPFNEEYRVTTRLVRKGKNKIKFHLTNEGPELHLNLPLIVNVVSNHSMTDYAHNAKNRRKLKETIKDTGTNRIEAFVERTQEEFKANPFGWSLAARKKFRTIPAFEAFDWMKTYPDMKVVIHVDLEFGKFGRQSEVPKLKNVRD